MLGGGYLLQADDSLPGVSVGGDEEGVCSLRVHDAVLDVGVDAQVFVGGFDLPHRLPHLRRLGDVQLVVPCSHTHVHLAARSSEEQRGAMTVRALLHKQPSSAV